MITVGRIALGVTLAALAGGSLLPRPARLCGGILPGWCSLAVALGLAVLVPFVFIVGLLGLPVFGWWMVGIQLSIATLACWFGPRRTVAVLAVRDLNGPRAWLSSVVLLGALVSFGWKIAVVPVWTWDHYMVWGAKARRLVDSGFMDLQFLRVSPFRDANPDYPLGLPLLWRVLTLGQEPTSLDFKVCHLLFGLAVVSLVRLVLFEAGATAFRANVVAALVAVSPLFWDTESLGLAEMPLCATALAGLCLVLRWRSTGFAKGGWLTGVMLGFLPWIKKEGLWLAILLLGAGWVLSRLDANRRPVQLAAAALAFAVMGGGALLVEWIYLPGGLSFMTGSWWSRVVHRVPDAMNLFSVMCEQLVAIEWLGFWFAFPLVIICAVWWRAEVVLAVCGVVLGQVGLYAAVYLATYLDPVAHITVSFSRVMGALLPLAAVGMGLLGLDGSAGGGVDEPRSRVPAGTAQARPVYKRPCLE